jgi:hypothetical protein
MSTTSPSINVNPPTLVCVFQLKNADSAKSLCFNGTRLYFVLEHLKNTREETWIERKRKRDISGVRAGAGAHAHPSLPSPVPIAKSFVEYRSATAALPFCPPFIFLYILHHESIMISQALVYCRLINGYLSPSVPLCCSLITNASGCACAHAHAMPSWGQRNIKKIMR